MDLNCTKCGSDHTQKVSAIYSQGTSRGSASSSSTTVGAVGDRAAVAATSTSTSSFSQTDLAEQLQPPQMKRSTWFFPAIGVGMWLGWVGAFLGLIVGAIVVKVLRMNGDNVGLFVFAGVIWAFWRSFVRHYKLAIVGRKYNREDYPREIEAWRKQFYCHRCDTVFTPPVSAS